MAEGTIMAMMALTGDPLKRVFGLLDVQALCSAAQVCKEWRSLGDYDVFWQELAAHKWPSCTLCLQPNYDTYKLDRVNGRFRLCFDARGETDLRHPATSQLALVSDRPVSNFNPGGVMQPDHSHLLRAYSFKRACHISESSPGHYKGWLEWTDLDLLKKNTHLTVMGPTALVFCYANSVTQAPSHYFEADYLGAALLKIPDKGNIEEAFLAQSSSYQLPYEPEQKLAAQTPEEERALWHSLSDQS